MPKISSSFEFDPTDERFLRSAERREIPQGGSTFVAGASYPTEEDLAEFFAAPTDGPRGAEFAFSCPIVGESDRSTRRVLYSRTLVLSPRRRDAHLAFWGPTGTGKTTKGMQPLLLSDCRDPQRIVIDASLKGEGYAIAASACEQQGVPLLYINLDDPSRSCGFNPLQDIDDSEAYSTIATFVDLSVRRDARESEFWRQAGTTFMYAAWCAGCRSFAEILDLFESPRSELLARLGAFGSTSCRAAASFLQSGSTNADTVQATVSGWLNPWRQAGLRATTNAQELDRRSLFTTRKVIVIRCPETKLSSLRPVYNLLIQWFLDAAVDAADAHPHAASRPSVSFHIEDLPAWGPFGCLVDRMATLRSRRISISASIQSMAQLRYAYGDAAQTVEKAFVNKILLPGLDQDDAEYFCRHSGEMQVIMPIDGGHLLDRNVTSRYVLSAGDIRNPHWRHFLLGQPATFLLQDTMFQAYLCPIYLRSDVPRSCHGDGSPSQPPLRKRKRKARRRQSDEVVGDHQAGSYHFDGCVERADFDSFGDWKIVLKTGDIFPRTPAGAKCWWRAVR